MNDKEGMEAYYAKRAAEYERIYAKPERQTDLAALTELVSKGLTNHNVLEIACGTGWWTERYAPAAAKVYATDVNEEVLAVARSKSCPPGRVEFAVADAFDAAAIPGDFDAVFAGFWWSHLEHAAIPAFLAQLHRRLAGAGKARFIFLDNRYVAGSSTPVAETDAAGNTWQLRKLDDGSTHRVLKNFPDEKQLRAAVGSEAKTVKMTQTQYFWLLEYEL
jgi:ubiquinone/menaquinone biosynthesis C-methylase UbiE